MNALPRKLQAQQGPVWIYNRCPRRCHHYEESLFDVLAAAGITARSADAPSVEVLGASKWGRARAALAELGAHAQRAGSTAT